MALQSDSRKGSKAGWIVAIVVAGLGAPVLVELVKGKDGVAVGTREAENTPVPVPKVISTEYPDIPRALGQYFDVSQPIALHKEYDLQFYNENPDHVRVDIRIITSLKNFSFHKEQYYRLVLQGDDDASLDSFKYKRKGERWVSLSAKRQLEGKSSFIESVIDEGLKIKPREIIEVEKRVSIVKELDGELGITSSETILSGVDFRYSYGADNPGFEVMPYVSTTKFYTGAPLNRDNISAQLSITGLVLAGQGAVFVFKRKPSNQPNKDASR